jgi:3',5'-cyclic AMP phosphodiesterase CpdA
MVPGNHDAYVRPALAAHAIHWHEFMRDDEADTAALRFPFVRRRGPLALIGLSSAVPTAPFMATGRLGAEQIARLDALLERFAGICRVVLIHHPPQGRRGDRFKRLIDATALRDVLRRRGAELVLHGHDHVHALNWLDGPRGPIPALGVPSASAVRANNRHADRAAYNLYRIEGSAGAYTCEAVTRGFHADTAHMVEIARRELKLAS